ncbi:RNA-directed DNA polymerase from mobile element jockey [Scomber scombrus]|uniref:RNA-directed DNA polymerase from mobile element jockey n=1 Tax=Scomber scombrus TaxID=13677 RepID=A0AAV1Q463_SCOSC
MQKEMQQYFLLTTMAAEYINLGTATARLLRPQCCLHASTLQSQPQIHSIHQWSEDSTAQLRGSLACTDWDIFSGGSLNERVEVITDYIKFCISSTIQIKAIKKYPNSKPWITPHIFHSLREKQNAFPQQDWTSLKSITQQIKNDIFKAKLRYKEKLEQEFSTMNTKQAFQKVKTLTSHNTKPTLPTITDPISFAENLNIFYTRFDTRDYSEGCRARLETIPLPDPTQPDPFSVDDVCRQLSRCKPGKSPGPDHIQARVLKECATELSPVMHSIFQDSYRTATVPTQKTPPIRT